MKTNQDVLQDAITRLTKNAIVRGFQQEALHEYKDLNGEVLYWRIRLKNPVTKDKVILPLKRHADTGYALGEPKFSNKKPLYNQHALKECPEATIWICEGEWCADHLAGLGLLALTSGSADGRYPIIVHWLILPQQLF